MTLFITPQQKVAVMQDFKEWFVDKYWEEYLWEKKEKLDQLIDDFCFSLLNNDDEEKTMTW